MSGLSWSRRKAGVRVNVALGLLISVVVCVLLATLLSFSLDYIRRDKVWESQVPQRHLLAELHFHNCTPPSIEQYPRTLFNQEQRVHGAITIHIIVAIYMFLALAIVCDSYFVPSLEVICDILKISADVGGATFMAAGSSAPELATAIIAVFVSKDDIGLGTVVGSAVYNVTFVISICGLFAGMVVYHDWWPLVRDCLVSQFIYLRTLQVVYLHWWPLVRDCVIYTLSIVALILVILDGAVTWWEAIILVAMYILYILLMFVNKRLETWMLDHVTCCPQHFQHTQTYHKLANNDDESPTSHQNGFVASEKISYDHSSEKVSFSGPQDEACETTALLPGKKEETVMTFPSGAWRRTMWIISLPITIVLYLTTPDCSLERWRRWFAVTFIISLLWLSAFSYIIVWMITIIGFTFGIPDTIMGLTFIAFGVSIPDAIASMIVVREGEGDMAVSNAVGSNIFDILICLGIPWFLKTAIDAGRTVPVRSSGLVYSAVTLLSTVVILLGVTHLNKWKMNKKYGAILMVMYVIVTVLSALYESDLFGFTHIPECPSDY